MRDNIEGQSAEPVANGSVSGSSNIAEPISAATGVNQPAAEASAATPTNTPVINTSGATTSEKGSIDFAAMSKSKEEQTDEELLTNALTKKDKAEAKKIIAKRKKEAKKAEHKTGSKKLGLIIGIIAVILVITTAVVIAFTAKKPADETPAVEDFAKIINDPDYNYKTNKATINEQKIKSELIDHQFIGIDVTGVIDAAKVRSNLDAVVDAQTDEYVKQYYRLYEIVLLLENSYISEASELIEAVNEDSLDENQLMPYYYAMYLYNDKVLGDKAAAEEYLTKYGNYF